MLPIDAVVSKFKSFDGSLTVTPLSKVVNKYLSDKGSKGPFITISGENGTGKSTILESIVYCLYGKLPKINLKELVNRQDEEMSATINLLNIKDLSEGGISNGFPYINVKRSHNKTTTKTSLTVSSSTMKEGAADYSDIQEYKFPTIATGQSLLEGLIKVNFDQFVNFFYYGKDTVPFTAQGDTQKKELIESILGINWNDYLKQMRKDLKERTKQLNIAQGSITGLTSRLQSYKDGLKNEGAYQSTDRKFKYDSGEKYKSRRTQLSNYIDKRKDKLSTARANLSLVDTQLDDFEDLSTETKCPRCGGIINKEHVAKEIKTLENRRKRYTSHVNKYTKEVVKYENELEELEEEWEEFSKVQQVKTTLRQYIQEVNKELRTQYKSLKTEEYEIKHIEYAISLIDNSGELRLWYIRNLLKVLNLIIRKFLSFIDEPGYHCSFHVEDDGSIYTCAGNTSDTDNYFNLSKGERRRIDMAVMFSLNMVYTKYNPDCLKILLLDEVFDGLDSKGIKSILEMIEYFRNEDFTPVMCVTHNSVLINTSVPDKQLELSKDKDTDMTVVSEHI